MKGRTENSWKVEMRILGCFSYNANNLGTTNFKFQTSNYLKTLKFKPLIRQQLLQLEEGVRSFPASLFASSVGYPRWR